MPQVNANLLASLANPQPLKIDFKDPLEQYANALGVANAMYKMEEGKRKEQSVNAMRQVFKKGIRPDGTYDEGQLRYGAAQADVGENIPDLDEWFNKNRKNKSEVDENNAQTRKTKVETRGKALENLKHSWSRVDTKDPRTAVRQVMGILQRESQDPDLAEMLAEQGMDRDEALHNSLGELDAAIKSNSLDNYLRKQMLGIEHATKMHYAQVNAGDRVITQAMPEYDVTGAPKPQVIATNVVGKSPNAPKTTVTVNNPGPKAANKFGDTLGEERAKQFVAMENANRSALQAAPRVDRAIALLDDGVTAGALAGQITDARALAKQFGFNVDDKRLINTQELRQLLISGVFDHVAQLKSQGVSLTPMTDHDIELLKQSVAKGTDDVETIRRSLLTYRKVLQEIHEQYVSAANRYGESPVGPALRAVPTDPGAAIPNRPSGLTPAAQEYLGAP